MILALPAKFTKVRLHLMGMLGDVVSIPVKVFLGTRALAIVREFFLLLRVFGDSIAQVTCAVLVFRGRGTVQPFWVAV